METVIRRRELPTQPDRSRPIRPPNPHPSGATAPNLPAEFVPRHVALVMDGNGRWAQDRGLPRTAGHERGEAVLMDTVEG
jgi:undecaprenyl diphosphate synthase